MVIIGINYYYYIINSTPYENITLVYHHAFYKNRSQESKRTRRTTAKESLSTRLLKTKLIYNILQPQEQTWNPQSNTAHSASLYSTVPVYGKQWWFIFHHWIVPDLNVCLCMWERKRTNIYSQVHAYLFIVCLCNIIWEGGERLYCDYYERVTKSSKWIVKG